MHTKYDLSKAEATKLELVLTRNCYLPNIVSHEGNLIAYDLNGVVLIRRYSSEDGTMELYFIGKNRKDISLMVSEIEDMAEINL
ncbi:MAG: hypothetical protein WC584_03620 [Candidatus Pacearchaeota archaeon]